MSRPLPWILLAVAAVLCVVASYALRYGLMEGAEWVGVCADTPEVVACQIRGQMGWLIHHRVIAWGALLCALVAFVLPSPWGVRLAVPGLLLGLPALILYSASLAVFAIVLALLRLVRAPRPAAI